MTKSLPHSIPGWVLSAIPAVVLVALSYRLYGPGMSPDSVSYLSAANSFQSNGTMLGVDGLPLTNWPPLYPFLLSFVNGALLNLLSLVATAYLVWRLVQAQPRPILLTVTAVLSVPVLKPASMLWSEPFFLVLLLGTLVSLQQYFASKSVNQLFLFAILLALLCLQRYVGLFFAVAFGILALRHRHLKLSLAVLLALIPLAAWFMRNYFVKFNTPYASFIHWDNGCQNLLACLQSFSLPMIIKIAFSWLVWSVWMGGCAFAAVKIIRNPTINLQVCLGLGLTVYLMAILNWALLSPAELARYLLPVFVLLLVMLPPSFQFRSFLISMVWVINLGALAWQTNRWLLLGAGGYSTAEWQALPIPTFTQAIPANQFMSNAPDLIYLRTGQRCPFIDTSFNIPVVIWIQPIQRQTALYSILIQKGFQISKDSAGIQLLLKP